MVKTKMLVSKIRDMKDKLIKSLQIFVVLAVMFIATVMISSLGNNSTKHIFTDNMKDCQEKGGEYVLWINPAGEVQVEKCKIDREIYYFNK